MLRVPKRSLLHETDPEDVLREAAVVASSRDRRIDVPAALAAVAGPGGIDGEVRHLVALSSGAGEGGSKGPVVGGETSMRLSSPIGPRGSIRLAGRKESLEAEGRMGRGLAPGRRDDASVSVGFNYDTGPDESIEMSAYWSERDLRYASGVPDPADEGGALSREGHRSWGYDATWTKQLDDPRESERAVTQLEQLGDPSAIPALGNAWANQGKPVRLLQVIISLARPLTPEEAKATYMTDYEKTGRKASWDKAAPFLIKALTEVDEANPRSVDGGMVPKKGAYAGESSPFSGTYRPSNATMVGSL